MKDNLSPKKQIDTLVNLLDKQITETQRQILITNKQQKENVKQLNLTQDEKRKTWVEPGTHSSNYILDAFDYNLALNNKINTLKLESRKLKNKKNKLNKELTSLIRKKTALTTVQKKREKTIENEKDKQESLIAQEIFLRKHRYFD